MVIYKSDKKHRNTLFRVISQDKISYLNNFKELLETLIKYAQTGSTSSMTHVLLVI